MGYYNRYILCWIPHHYHKKVEHKSAQQVRTVVRHECRVDVRTEPLHDSPNWQIKTKSFPLLDPRCVALSSWYTSMTWRRAISPVGSAKLPISSTRSNKQADNGVNLNIWAV